MEIEPREQKKKQKNRGADSPVPGDSDLDWEKKREGEFSLENWQDEGRESVQERRGCNWIAGKWPSEL